MTRILALAAVVLALTTVGCSDSPAGPDGTGVTVQDNSFNPSSRAVTAGQTVTWTWAGSNQHDVTWDTGSPAASPTQASGTYDRTFATAGTYSYHCTIHGSAGAGMHGTVTVQ
jgi:plastocyanin